MQNMKILWILIFCSVISNSVLSKEINTIEFDYKSFSLKDSISKELSFDQIIDAINYYCSTDIQKLCLVAGWFYENIDFDLEKFITSGGANDYRTVFKLKKGICGDYSALFSEFCNRLNITNEIIEGYVPEYNSDNKVYYDTNHAWNVIRLGNKWYHCDLLGFSGVLNIDRSGRYHFIKKPDTSDFLTQDLRFLSKHIPADPIWQLSNFPIPLDTLISYGNRAKIDSTQKWFDYNARIGSYINLPETEKSLQFADNAFDYNRNNSNVVVINYYNAAVDLINNGKNDRNKLIKAKKYLEKSKTFLPNARNGVEVLKDEINKGLAIINQSVL